MGGSGGLFSGHITPERLKQLVKQAAERTQDEEYEGEVADRIGSILAQYNNRDTEI